MVPGKFVVVGKLRGDVAGGPEILFGEWGMGGLRGGGEIAGGIEMACGKGNLRVRERSAEEGGQREEGNDVWHLLTCAKRHLPTVNEPRKRWNYFNPKSGME